MLALVPAPILLAAMLAHPRFVPLAVTASLHELVTALAAVDLLSLLAVLGDLRIPMGVTEISVLDPATLPGRVILTEPHLALLVFSYLNTWRLP